MVTLDSPESVLSLYLALAALFVALLVLVLYWLRIRHVGKEVYRQAEAPLLDDALLPKVSVIVYTFGNSEGLSELLLELFTQEYPNDYEVIVVNDGNDDATDMLLSQLERENPNLYHTFTPPNTRNLSRKKLALTIGIKAAQYDDLLLLTSESRLNSTRWLRHMAAPFADPQKEIVIGFAVPETGIDTRRGNRIRSFDHLMEGVNYLSAALDHRTYRGDGDNLGYRRRLFFNHKGFSNSLDLHYGDDDLFIAESATPDNVAVVLHPEAIVTTVTADPVNTFRQKKLRYDFTANFAGGKQHLLNGFCSLLMWIWFALAVATIAVAPTCLIAQAINLFAFIVLWVPVTVAWRRNSIALGARTFMFSVPWFSLWRPIRNSAYRYESAKMRDAHYSWKSPS